MGEAFSLIYVDSEGLGLTPETFEKHRVQIQQRKKRLKQKDRNENKAHQLAEVCTVDPMLNMGDLYTSLKEAKNVEKSHF